MVRAGLILASLALVVAAVGCGGGGGGGSAQKTTTTSSEPPGKALLTKAGLEQCAQHQATGAGFVGTGFVQSQAYVVAPDCSKAPAVPTTVSALSYTTQDTAAQAVKAIQKAQPKAVVQQGKRAPYTTTVFVVSGPKAKEYAAKIRAAVPS